MPLVLKIAWRFLTYEKFQSLLIILGVATGVSVQMFVGLLINSVQNNITTSTLGSIPHITIEPNTRDDLIDEPNEILKKVNGLEGITKKEIIAEKGAIVLGPVENFPIVFRGLEPESDDVFKIRENIILGRYFETEREVTIGIELFEELELELGDAIVITNKEDEEISRVVGVFEQGLTAIDKGLVVGHIKSVRSFFGLRQKATSIGLQVNDLIKTDQYEDGVISKIGSNKLSFSDWQKENELLRNALSSQDTSNYIIQTAILASVVVAITSVLSITVLQKARQIGILKAMGMSNKKTSQIFLASSFTLGALGASFGLILGIIMYLTFVTNNTNPDGTQIFEPIIDWVFVVGSWFVATSVATFAGIIPARRSANLDPIEIIQNG